MAGNTRGKLKEHFEGIHRNLDWSLTHIQKSLGLIFSELKAIEIARGNPVDDERMKLIVGAHPLYKGILALGEGIQTLDNLAGQVYVKL